MTVKELLDATTFPEDLTIKILGETEDLTIGDYDEIRGSSPILDLIADKVVQGWMPSDIDEIKIKIW